MNYAVILAGGVGTRFWPFSREFEPKQFMQVAGEESLLQSTIRRLGDIIAPENTFVITNEIYFFEVDKQISPFGIPRKNIILEPQGKNTAPAAGLCARLLNGVDKDAVMIVMPADHYIKDLRKFAKVMKRAILAANDGKLVTIGVAPKFASTGYGYIRLSSRNALEKERGGYFIVDKFLEKPVLAKAKKYFKDRRFYWNSGIFAWKASVFLNEIKMHLPGLYTSLNKINSVKDISKVWSSIKPVSIDYGIMEHSQRIALIPADFFWTDLGSWDALNEIMPKNNFGNVIKADSLDLESRDICVLSRSNRLICTIGVKDLIIADTPDALLVCDKNKTQEVKKVVELLKGSERKEHIAHKTEKRPWGSYTVLQVGEGFKIKLIEIDPKKRLSLQSHKKRAEHWVVVSGCAKVTSANKIKLVKNNQSVYIPKNTTHRLENPFNEVLKIVEVQTGTYLEEDDIIRFDDDFKRQKNK